jgi:multiple sugar transport system ATP-binding protein
VARLEAATEVREGETAELWVDARAMHVFDPATGRNLSLAIDDGGGAVTGAPAAAQPVSAEAGRTGDDDAGAGQAAAGSASAGEEVT